MPDLEDKEEVYFFDEEEDNEIENIDDKKRSELQEIAEIVVSGTDWTTETILNQLVRGNIKLNPRFQRRDAWNVARKSRFIESLILGFPIPQIVLAADNKERGKFIVLDGKQRLLTILQFYGRSETPNNAFSLKDLEFRTELNNHKHEELKNNLLFSSELDNLDNQPIRTMLIRNWRSESFLYKIFLRLNVESTPLSPQELRQALHPGPFINFLDDQSINSQSLRRILRSKSPDFRMRDVELLLRYVAFHYFLAEYRGNLKAFLDMTCKVLNKDWQDKSNDIQIAVENFEKAVETTIEIFGERNFSRMWLTKERTFRSQFNRAILDAMVFYFSDEDIRRSAEEKKVEVENAFKDLCSNNEFKASVEGTTKNIRETFTRLSLWGESLLNTLDIEFNIPKLIDKRIVFNGLR
uniref:GmrSD restriction endonucleases N-terminal domain-containing protein n=1 Tax=Cyanothece sp. (strain PCC 7425 / ATCC 29141) TaxID=395961 RepID=B8HLQ0_CYAP4